MVAVASRTMVAAFLRRPFALRVRALPGPKPERWRLGFVSVMRRAAAPSAPSAPFWQGLCLCVAGCLAACSALLLHWEIGSWEASQMVWPLYVDVEVYGVSDTPGCLRQSSTMPSTHT
jgi:hypothetical protein